MALTVKHKFVSAKPEHADTTLVRASNWNDDHDILMATNRLLGRTTAGAGAVEELTAGEGLSFTAGALNLDLNELTDIGGGGGITGITHFVFYNSNLAGNRKINRSDMIDFIDGVPDSRRVEAGNGLENGAGGAVLNTDVIIHLRTPGTLNSTTTNDPNGAHTHDINQDNVASVGCSNLSADQLGSYTLGRQNGGGAAKTWGDTMSGSAMQPASAAAGGGAATPSGSWRCMGRVTGDTAANGSTNITLWLRIS